MKDTITYTNAGGGTVTWRFARESSIPWAPASREGKWKCSGCGRGGYGDRFRAEDHAAKCRAR